ncbi:MAG: hypothetical protein KAT70_09785 [Thermoplasmata archaeon]|nr:hypothetical protein [Thermoplasmata archaeon]
MEVQVQPLMIDQYEVQATSKYLNAASANDGNTRIYGLSKKEATMNAQFYKESHVNEMKDPEKKRGRVPRMWWLHGKFRHQKAKGVSLQSYGAFSVWINGNPTEFQKEDYAKNGHIDIKKNRMERRHHDNYIHTDICKLPPEQIEAENREYLPHAWEISEFICQNVLGHQPYGNENPNIYTHLTFRNLEVNQDLLTYPHDSVMVGNQLWRYLTGPDGQSFIYDSRCLKMKSTMNTKFAGAQIILTYKEAELKIYPKTHHSLRVEVVIDRAHIQKHCGNRSTDNLQRLIDEIVKPLLQKTDIARIIRDQPPIQDISPLLFEKTIDDPKTLHMVKKLMERRALTKDEAPKIFRNKGKKDILIAERMGKDWLYYLRPELLAGIDWYGGK